MGHRILGLECPSLPHRQEWLWAEDEGNREAMHAPYPLLSPYTLAMWEFLPHI